MAKKDSNVVVPMFDRDHTFEEARLDVSHLAAGQEARPTATTG